MSDLTVVYITANEISETFAQNMRNHLVKAIGENPIIAVSRKPMDTIVKNIVVDMPRSHVNIYRQALAGVKAAETKYVAIVEDDILYPKEHFQKRPTRSGVFAYNIAYWSLYTWSDPPIFSYTGRRIHGMLICERDLYIEAMEERFAKYPDESQINIAVWAEPGKYESQLGVTVRESEVFYTDPSCIMFSHPEGLSFTHLGMRKRLAPIRAYEIPYWGRAEAVVTLYE